VAVADALGATFDPSDVDDDNSDDDDTADIAAPKECARRRRMDGTEGLFESAIDNASSR
jgi:hypothetical protein